jgi:hypothetical protein
MWALRIRRSYTKCGHYVFGVAARNVGITHSAKLHEMWALRIRRSYTKCGHYAFGEAT